MKWPDLLPQTRTVLNLICKDIQHKNSGADYHLSRIAVSLEREWSLNKVLSVVIAVIAVAVSLFTAVKTINFLEKERADRQGSIICTAYLGKGNYTIESVIGNRFLQSKDKTGPLLVYDCGMKQDYYRNSLYLVWHSLNGAVVDKSDVERILNNVSYKVSIFSNCTGDFELCSFGYAELGELKYDGRYSYFAIHNIDENKNFETVVGSTNKNFSIFVESFIKEGHGGVEGTGDYYSGSGSWYGVQR